ncbi:ATP-binding cassette, subfamily B [Singulisphaera sp. GP187]|uniref:cyanophycin metabolism-associated ABC transporter n=1 Tax=Singulisphaera sp. GP187 TaxID=1882752 RepID=UPI00092768A4|nr:ABC transporter ATP-binding protein [Singulisphaera sp. GP187]SIN78607.1 ATP-binding cassette, subfamily B [Singulisphaera sp. GP187]
MIPKVDGVNDGLGPLPGAWGGELETRLEPGERPLAWFAPDLDHRLHYGTSLLVLTDRRLLHGEPAAPDDSRAAATSPHWQSWPITEDLTLRTRDRAGLGSLELVDPAGRLAYWRYTIGRNQSAHRFIERFDALARDGRDGPDSASETVCPSCGAVLTSAQATCSACSSPSASKAASALLRLSQFARPRGWMIALGFMLTLASTAASLVPAALTEPLVDQVLIPYEKDRTGSFRLVGFYLFWMTAAYVAAWLLGWARTYVLAWVSERVSADLRNQTYSHLHKLSLEFFGGKRTGDLMSRLTSDTDRICNFLSINLLDFATDVIMIAMTVALLCYRDPLLAIAALVPFPIIMWLVQFVRYKMLRALQQGSRAWAAMSSVLADTIPGIRVVKAFAQERREVERFHQTNDHVLAVNDRVNTIWSFFGPMTTFLTQGGLLIVWGVGAWMIFDGNRITVGALTMFLTLIARFYMRLEAMLRMVQATQRAGVSAQRIFEILDRAPSVAEPARPIHPDRIEGAIELRQVAFRHGSRSILGGIDLAIRPGEMIGLVGASGAGKSTLVNLVCRFYDVSDGAILVDGVDIRSYAISEYRRHIGIVLQEPFLFYGTIAENIAYGRPNAERGEIIAAARAARAHDFILRLPDGYDSIVGERGQALSGGERQRISIARAILIDPRILILDEATSSVDTETEREIQEALDNLIRGRTTIAIAHRLSTLRRADRLVVLEHGRIAEVGPPNELLKRPGAYSRLHRAQMELVAGQASL